MLREMPKMTEALLCCTQALDSGRSALYAYVMRNRRRNISAAVFGRRFRPVQCTALHTRCSSASFSLTTFTGRE